MAESDKGHEARRARREARERERARVEEDIDRTRAEGFAAQHVRTTDPQIVALVEKAWQDKVAARDRAFQWTRGHGLEGASLFGQDMGLHFSVMGLSEKPEGLGEWVRARGGGWKPAASNPLREELAVLGYEPPHFPGVERAYRASGDEPASGWFLFPTPFVADGAAWVSLGQFPDKGGKFGPQWEEVTGSQAAAAETKFRAAGD